MIPVQLTQLLTPQLMYNFMHDTLNMYSLTRSDIAYSPMALGSLSNGVTLLEMAGAYQMFSNGGLRTEPYAYTKVVDSNGNIVLQTNTTPTRVISYETASVMNKMLQTVTTGIYGTGVTARLSSGIPVAGKTGTTDDNVDQWFIGVTPYYIGVCWLGYDDQYQTVTDENGNVTYLKDSGGNRIPNSIRYASGLNYPPPKLWKTVMDKVHEGLAVKDFTYSSEMVQMSYCTLTGYAATDDCESTAIGYYKSTNIPSACPYHGDSYLSSNVPLYGEKTEPEYDEDD